MLRGSHALPHFMLMAVSKREVVIVPILEVRDLRLGNIV